MLPDKSMAFAAVDAQRVRDAVVTPLITKQVELVTPVLSCKQ